MRIGIFGGTFNPVHLGHLRAAEEVREALDLEKVLFVPSYIPPHKELASDVPGSVRLEIVRLATRGETRIRSEPSSTCGSAMAAPPGSSWGRTPSMRS
jgi:cytidyltransferase-like protein